VPEVVPEVVAPEVRFPAIDSNTTKRPSAEIMGFALSPSASTPAGPVLTNRVVPPRSATNTFRRPDAPLEEDEDTRLLESDTKAIRRPFPEIEGSLLVPSPDAPAEFMLTRTVWPPERFVTKI
jgi:hypothetical protein